MCFPRTIWLRDEEDGQGRLVTGLAHLVFSAVPEFRAPGQTPAGLRLHSGAAGHRILGADAPEGGQGLPALHARARRQPQ